MIDCGGRSLDPESMEQNDGSEAMENLQSLEFNFGVNISYLFWRPLSPFPFDSVSEETKKSGENQETEI